MNVGKYLQGHRPAVVLNYVGDAVKCGLWLYHVCHAPTAMLLGSGKKRMFGSADVSQGLG